MELNRIQCSSFMALKPGLGGSREAWQRCLRPAPQLEQNSTPWANLSLCKLSCSLRGMELKVCLPGAEAPGDKALPRPGDDGEQALIPLHPSISLEQRYGYLQHQVSQTRCFLAAPQQHQTLSLPAVSFSTVLLPYIS